MDCVAFESATIDSYPTRSAWDATAAELVQTMLDRWHLIPGEAYVGGEAASVLAVTMRDGTPAVLKVGFPHAEAVGEALALEVWSELSPELCPRVIRQDPWTWSMLLEQVRPGIPLSRSGRPARHALELACDVYARAAACPIPAGIPSLGDIVGGYLPAVYARLDSARSELVGLGAYDTVARGLDTAHELTASDSGEWFLHGDFNPGNLLLDTTRETERWLVIDPKPMRGDREFDLWPLVEQLGSPWTRSDPSEVLARQLRLVCERLRCDYERAARWACARAALTVSWYLDEGNQAAAVSGVRELATCWRLIEP